MFKDILDGLTKILGPIATISKDRKELKSLLLKKKAFLICLLCSFLFLESCSFTNNEKNISFSEAENNEETGYVREEAGFFDSADTAVVTSIDLTEGMITFHNFQLGKNYT